MTELTPPVQKNFYAVGHRYLIGHGENKHKATYMGAFLLSDGKVEHVFAYERWHDKLKRPHGCSITEYDTVCSMFVHEVPDAT